MKRGLVTNELNGRFVHFFPDDPLNPKGDTVGDRRGRAKQEKYEKWLRGEELRKIERERLRRAYAMLLERRPPTMAEIARDLGMTNAKHLIDKLIALGLAERDQTKPAHKHRAYRAIIPEKLIPMPLGKGPVGQRRVSKFDLRAAA